mmetsp:Transcript_8940/g.19479  ORF Transcript_8940/g.19479 Transcript_8940/m.19479 type:complete len:217 (-) Transcript_8940:727-1377(-)
MGRGAHVRVARGRPREWQRRAAAVSRAAASKRREHRRRQRRQCRRCTPRHARASWRRLRRVGSQRQRPSATRREGSAARMLRAAPRWRTHGLRHAPVAAAAEHAHRQSRCRLSSSPMGANAFTGLPQLHFERLAARRRSTAARTGARARVQQFTRRARCSAASLVAPDADPRRRCTRDQLAAQALSAQTRKGRGGPGRERGRTNTSLARCGQQLRL